MIPGKIIGVAAVALVHWPVAYEISLRACEFPELTGISVGKTQGFCPEPQVVEVPHKAVASDNKWVVDALQYSTCVVNGAEFLVVLVDLHGPRRGRVGEGVVMK